MSGMGPALRELYLKRKQYMYKQQMRVIPERTGCISAMDAEEMTEFFIDGFLKEKDFESDLDGYSQRLRAGRSF